MQITLNYYELIDAIEKKLNDAFDGSIDLDTRECEISFEKTEYDRQPKKHKNGRIVKNEYGHTVYEIVGSKKQNHNFTENDEITIYITSY